MSNLNKTLKNIIFILATLLVLLTIFIYFGQRNNPTSSVAQEIDDSLESSKIVNSKFNVSAKRDALNNNFNSNQHQQSKTISTQTYNAPSIYSKEAFPTITLPTESAISAESGKSTNISESIDLRSLNDYKYIALTFDDGPHSNIDLKILDLLDKYSGHATFFVLGTQLDERSEIIKAIAEQGSEIGNHSFSHVNFTKINNNQLIAEVNDTNEKIKQYTDISPTLIRVPFGAYNSKILEALPYPVMLWNHDTFDWQSQDASQISTSLNQASPGSVILMHSLYPTTLEALEKSLPVLYEQGYRFVTVTDLYKIYGVDLIPHRCYFSPTNKPDY